eukprot:UN23038
MVVSETEYSWSRFTLESCLPFWILSVCYMVRISAFPTYTKQELNCDSDTLKLFLNWGAILGIPPWFWVLPKSLKPLNRQIIFGLFLLEAALLLRLIPFWFPDSFLVTDFPNGRVLWVHIGSILNAVSGVFAMGLVGTISERYFPPHERGAATSTIYLCLTAGNSFQFAIAPIFIDEMYK